MVFGLFRHRNRHRYIRTDNRVRRSPYSHKGNIGESDRVLLNDIVGISYLLPRRIILLYIVSSFDSPLPPRNPDLLQKRRTHPLMPIEHFMLYGCLYVL